MKSSSNLENADALTNFLILDHLEKAGVSLDVRNQLAKEVFSSFSFSLPYLEF